MPETTETNYMSEDGTIWTYPNTIKSDDLSSFKEISDGIETKGVQMYDREADGGKGDFINYDAFAFDIKYDDGIEAKVNVRKKDYEKEDVASEVAKKYAKMMGQLPACLRKGVQHINIMKGNREWGGNSSLKSLDIQIGTISEDYETRGILEETLVHESCHAALDSNYYESEKKCKGDWENAQNEDKKFISKYAADNPCREDVAESFVPYIAVEYRRTRINKDAAEKINSTIPNRIKLFNTDKLDMYPLTVKDKDGNIYKTVKIGNQLWMAENLRTTKFRNGTSIPQITDKNEWVKQNKEAYTWSGLHENDQQTKEKYGALYNAYAAMNPDIAPDGWRIPTQADFQTLLDNLKPNAHLKLMDANNWGSNSTATNESGWTALPAGGDSGDSPGSYDFDKVGYFWSTTKRSEGGNYLFVIHSSDAGATGVAGEPYGFSIRCIKDD